MNFNEWKLTTPINIKSCSPIIWLIYFLELFKLSCLNFVNYIRTLDFSMFRIACIYMYFTFCKIINSSSSSLGQKRLVCLNSIHMLWIAVKEWKFENTCMSLCLLFSAARRQLEDDLAMTRQQLSQYQSQLQVMSAVSVPSIMEVR